MCPRGGVNGLQNPDKGLMNFDLFKRIVDKFATERVWIDGIAIGNWGEPLLNPDLPRMIHYAKSHPTAMKPKTAVSVNTTLNHSPSPLELLKSGINSIIISISGMTQKVYSINHKGGNIEIVLKNIMELVKIRKREKLEKVKLRIVFHDYIYNSEDAELAKDFCVKHGLRFTLSHPSIISVEDAINFSRDKERLGNFYRKFIDLDKEIALMKTMDYDSIKNCHLRKKRVTVNFDGQLYRCCEVFEKKHFMGSIFDFNIKDIPNIDSDICRRCAETPISWRP
jgi:MoaA/NifB/PqqE/SkfB family radical SAM enzyme